MAKMSDAERQHRKRVAAAKQRLGIMQQAQAELTADDWEPPPDRGSLRRQLNGGIPEPVFVVDSLIPAGANLLINAQYKKGKTTCALNLVRAGADGDDLFGHYSVTRPGNVAWWNAEVTETTALLWLHEMKVRHPLRVFPLHLRGYSMPFAVSEVRDWAVRWLRKHKVKWWVVDPFGALYDGEENSNSEIRDWLRHLDEIKRRAGVEVLALVAHTGHDAQDDDAIIRARGGARLMDWPDVIWTYRAGNEHDTSRRYLGAYGRDVEVPEITLDFEPTTRTLTKVQGVTSRKHDRMASLAQKAAELTAAHHAETGEPINKTTLEQRLGSGKATYKRQAIEYAAEMGWLRIEDGRNNSRLHYPGQDIFRVGKKWPGDADEV